MAKSKSKNDVEELNKVWISIPSVRLQLAKLSKEGYEQYPLGDLIVIIRDIIKGKNNGN